MVMMYYMASMHCVDSLVELICVDPVISKLNLSDERGQIVYLVMDINCYYWQAKNMMGKKLVKAEAITTC